jgi:hypothetical protein
MPINSKKLKMNSILISHKANKDREDEAKPFIIESRSPMVRRATK